MEHYFKQLDEYYENENEDEKEIKEKCKNCDKNEFTLINGYKTCTNCGNTELFFNDEINDSYFLYKNYNVVKKYRYYKIKNIFEKNVMKSILPEKIKLRMIELFNLNICLIKDTYIKHKKSNINYNFIILKFLEILNVKGFDHHFQKNNSKSSFKKNDIIFQDILKKFEY